MRKFIIFFVLSVTMFSGCSSHFDTYTLSSENENAANSYKNVRLLNSDNKSETILAAVYLNDVYPKYTDGFAHFLISFYNPEHDNVLYFDRSQTPGDQDYVLLLNDENALASEALDHDDLLVDLMPVRNSWNRYYYVRYRLPVEKLILVLESDHTVRAEITYQIEQE
ncbi:MAG: hypothetical protein ABFR02_01675 [Campylobacterota bacterium]